jgi:hypothetical protein
MPTVLSKFLWTAICHANELRQTKEITIKNDGTYTSTSSDFGTSGSYTISGNKIIAKSISGSMFDITVTFSGDNMTWNGVTNNGITFKYVFQKINAVPNEVYPNYDSNYGLGSLWET